MIAIKQSGNIDRVESGQGLSQSFGLAGVAGGELFAVLEADYDGIPVCFRMARSMI